LGGAAGDLPGFPALRGGFSTTGNDDRAPTPIGIAELVDGVKSSFWLQ
jgi:hypothetical protein